MFLTKTLSHLKKSQETEYNVTVEPFCGTDSGYTIPLPTLNQYSLMPLVKDKQCQKLF